MAPRGQKSYCIWGEGPSPFPGLGISSTLNIDAGKFDTEAWSVAEGVDCLFHVNRTRASLCAPCSLTAVRYSVQARCPTTASGCCLSVTISRR